MMGIDNFDVVDGKLSRGAQPNQLALEQLSRLGCQTVVNLRDDPWPLEESICHRLGMGYVSAPLSGTRAPRAAEVFAILNLIRQCDGRVFVHCQYSLANGATTPDADIYFTLDGSLPGSAGPAAAKYAGPVALASGQIINYAAWRADRLPSHIGSRKIS